MQFKAQIMGEADIRRVLVRMAHEIVGKNRGAEDVCLAGVHTRGVPLAARLADNIAAITGRRPDTGSLDITLYRDDLSQIARNPVLHGTQLPFSVEDRTVILVDDVIFTGRTARAAMDAVMAVGRPARIQLAVLIDRGHTELPIRATYVGKNIPTALSEIVAVRLAETDGENRVCIMDRGGPAD